MAGLSCSNGKHLLREAGAGNERIGMYVKTVLSQCRFFLCAESQAAIINGGVWKFSGFYIFILLNILISFSVCIDGGFLFVYNSR